jgi:biopolymer transport protein TolR
MGAGAQRPLSDINVTPLVDVMLVLLVIFIITAPLMASSIKLDLPQTDAGQPNDAPKFVSLSVDAAGKVFFNDQPVTDEELATPPREGRGRQQGHRGAAARRPDRALRQGGGADGHREQGGLSRIGFVTEADAGRRSRADPLLVLLLPPLGEGWDGG